MNRRRQRRRKVKREWNENESERAEKSEKMETGTNLDVRFEGYSDGAIRAPFA